MYKRLRLTGILIAMLCSAHAQRMASIPNPVLPGVADAGVLKFNGEYYIGGVGTKGSFYRSADLVHWKGPVHVFTMNNDWATPFGIGNEQIHSNDISYVNGIFHLYWNVNSWARNRNVIRIGHATSAHVLGPYAEPVKSTWFDSRLDPRLFTDDDGRMYFYSVKFSDGNAIWGSRMKDPARFEGQPKFLFSSQPQTWETLDNRVAEGPWVFTYRNRYYMMYNANHTSPDWGNYALGVAEAPAPLDFSSSSKYPYPVVSSNQIPLEESYGDVLRNGTDDFHYTFQKPGDDWTLPAFKAQWQAGKPGFGSRPVERSTTRKIGTPWTGDQIWIRRAFVPDGLPADLALRVRHDGTTKVFLNGTPVYEGAGAGYLLRSLGEAGKTALKSGENLLAIYSEKGRRSNFIDVSLFDMKDERPGSILFTPGQPSVVKGPNGFEWWMVYMANKNQEPRGQFINRIHFFDRRLVADAITDGSTTGYHPPPAQPVFGDLFDDSSMAVSARWNPQGGNWKLTGGELVQAAHTGGKVFVKSMPSVNYLFEASVRLMQSRNAGVYAWWKDPLNWIRFGLDSQQHSWLYEQCSNGIQKKTFSALPPGFDYQVYHKLGVYKNSGVFTFRIDDIPAPGHSVVKADGLLTGIPGLYTQTGTAAFDGVCYTIGWDEWDENITGWNALTAGNPWQTAGSGLQLQPGINEAAVFKGDTLQRYEFSVQLSIREQSGTMGAYPVYIDKDNFVKTLFDVRKQQVTVSGKSKGLPIPDHQITVKNLQTLYPDRVNSDLLEKHFTLQATASVYGLQLRNTGNRDSLQNPFDQFNIYYQTTGGWLPLTGYRLVPSGHPGYSEIAFDPILAGALKLENKDPQDRSSISNIRVRESFRDTYNLRVVKLPDVLIFFIDNKEVLQLRHTYSASRVGLLAAGSKASFNGITLFGLP